MNKINFLRETKLTFFTIAYEIVNTIISPLCHDKYLSTFLTTIPSLSANASSVAKPI